MSRSKSEPTKEETGRYGYGGGGLKGATALLYWYTHTHTQICLGKSFAANSGIRSLGHGFGCAARANIKYSNSYFV